MTPLVRLFMLLPALAGLAACTPETGPSNERHAYVRLTTVEITDVRPTLALTGELRARSERDLSFRTGGRIVERHVDIGDHVTAGQLLARLDPVQQQADVANAEATLVAAEAQARQALSSFDRQKALVDKGFSTQSDFEAALSAERTATGNVTAARANLDIARTQLGYTELKAEADGVIIARNADVGEVAQAAKAVFTIAVDGPRDAVFDVYEQAFIAHPDPEKITVSLIADPAVSTGGTVREISPTVDTATGTVRVKVDVGQPPPSMSLGAPVLGHGETAAIRVAVLPWQALTALNGQPAVWVVGAEDKVSLRKVTVAAYETDRVLVGAGLETGERVVTDGGKMLAPGMKVEPLEGAQS